MRLFGALHLNGEVARLLRLKRYQQRRGSIERRGVVDSELSLVEKEVQYVVITFNSFGSVVGRGLADLGLQQWLGLRAQRVARSNFDHSACLCADGPNLTS
jgi:hypothetical protein